MQITRIETGFIAVISTYGTNGLIDVAGEGKTPEAAIAAADFNLDEKRRKLRAIGQAKAISDWQITGEFACPFNVASPAAKAYSEEAQAIRNQYCVA